MSAVMGHAEAHLAAAAPQWRGLLGHPPGRWALMMAI